MGGMLCDDEEQRTDHADAEEARACGCGKACDLLSDPSPAEMHGDHGEGTEPAGSD